MDLQGLLLIERDQEASFSDVQTNQTVSFHCGGAVILSTPRSLQKTELLILFLRPIPTTLQRKLVSGIFIQDLIFLVKFSTCGDSRVLEHDWTKSSCFSQPSIWPPEHNQAAFVHVHIRTSYQLQECTSPS